MIAPYKWTPVPPRVALLTLAGELVGEHGETLSFDDWPDGVRCWCDYDTARALLLDGRGEALCWNGEEITWRHRRFENDWKRRPSDVHVIRLPFYENAELTVRALVAWRDWLAAYGAAPVSTTGSAAWSLLRARLAKPLWTSMGDRPPLRQTLGGRQELGPVGAGDYRGRLAQLDLPAAYARELGHLRYGGHWFRTSTLPKHGPEWWAAEGRPVFVRACVAVPRDLAYGPLPRRPRRPRHGLAAAMLGADYPVGKRLQGVWCWQELAEAERHGVRVIRVLEAWVHLAGGAQPFLPWWEAVEAGRSMPGLAGLVAKTTGNALWGRFAMDARAFGVRSIRSKARGRMVARPVRSRGGLPGSHDLAETVSGRVRARLYAAMMVAGDELLSAHTDGVWVRDAALAGELPGWRLKQQARRLQLLDPQVLRYWPQRRRDPRVVFAGVPALLADEAFEKAWQRKFPDATETEGMVSAA